MTDFDRILHLVGAAASGVVILGASDGVAMPAWLMITAAAVSFATGATSSPMVKQPSIFTPKPDARGQVADAESPKP